MVTSNCTIIGVALEQYHNSVAKRPVYTVRTDAGLQHDVDSCHVDERDGMALMTGMRGRLTYEPTAHGMAYILAVRPEMQAAERSMA